MKRRGKEADKVPQNREKRISSLGHISPVSTVLQAGPTKDDIFTQRRRNIDAVAVFVTDDSVFDYDVEQRRGDAYITGSLDAPTFASADDVVFVVESNVRGAMGEELLPFSKRGDAAQFVDRYGGRIVDAEHVTAKLVNQL